MTDFFMSPFLLDFLLSASVVSVLGVPALAFILWRRHRRQEGK